MKSVSIVIVLMVALKIAAPSQKSSYRFSPNHVVALDTTIWKTFSRVEDQMAPNKRLTFGHLTRLGVYMEILADSYYDFGESYNEEEQSEASRISQFKNRPIHFRMPDLSECANGAFGVVIEPKGEIIASLSSSKNNSGLVVKMEFPIADSSYALGQIEQLIDNSTDLSPSGLDNIYGYPYNETAINNIYEKRFQEVKMQNQLFYEKNARCLNDPTILRILKNRFEPTLIDSLVAAQNITELAAYYGEASATENLTNWKYALDRKFEEQFTYSEYYALYDSLINGLVDQSEFYNYYKKRDHTFRFDRYTQLEYCESEITNGNLHSGDGDENGITFLVPFMAALNHQVLLDTSAVESISVINMDCDYLMAVINTDGIYRRCLLRYSASTSSYVAIPDTETFDIDDQTFISTHNPYKSFGAIHLYKTQNGISLVDSIRVISLNSGLAWKSIPRYAVETLPTAINYTECLYRPNEIAHSQNPYIKQIELQRFQSLIMTINSGYDYQNEYRRIYVFADSSLTRTLYYLKPEEEGSIPPKEKSFTTSLMEFDLNNDGHNELFQYTVSNGKLMRYVYYTVANGELISVQSRATSRQIKKTMGFRNLSHYSMMGS